MNHTYYYCCCFLLLLIAARGSGQTECTATEEGTLKCQFPENINSTQRDFSIYFDPDHGNEEQLVACSWVMSKLYCITQKGFEREGLVSETAVITIPRSFLSRNGSYRCESVDYPFITTPCRVPAWRDVENFEACEENSTFDDNHLSLKCNFPYTVEGFRVISNMSVLAKYTKASCKDIYPACRYKEEEGKTAFTLTLNTIKYPHDKMFCHPDSFSSGLEVKGCIVAMKTHTDDSTGLSAFVITIVFFVILVLLTPAVVVSVVFIRKRGQKEENNGKMKGFLKSLLPDTGTEVLQLQTYDVKPTSA